MPSVTKNTERLFWLLLREVGADVIVGGSRNDTLPTGTMVPSIPTDVFHIGRHSPIR